MVGRGVFVEVALGLTFGVVVGRLLGADEDTEVELCVGSSVFVEAEVAVTATVGLAAKVGASV